jgi:hypothetical protein
LDNYTEISTEKVVFSGINIGGLFAKILGLMKKDQSVSFHSFSVFNDFLASQYDLNQNDAFYITNVFNHYGIFSLQEPNLATNFGILTIPNPILNRDTIYLSFCMLAELCDERLKFNDYCESIIEKKIWKASELSFLRIMAMLISINHSHNFSILFLEYSP